MQDISNRARDKQYQAHRRIMLRQLARDEYVPARAPVDLVARIKEQLGGSSEVQVCAADGLPEVRASAEKTVPSETTTVP